jgi:hypothetical protein
MLRDPTWLGSLSRRDFSNGAVLDEITTVFLLCHTLIGGVRDLQRHVKVTVEEDPTRLPPGLLAVIGAMHKAIKEASE